MNPILLDPDPDEPNPCPDQVGAPGYANYRLTELKVDIRWHDEHGCEVKTWCESDPDPCEPWTVRMDDKVRNNFIRATDIDELFSLPACVRGGNWPPNQS